MNGRSVNPFRVKECALLRIATGMRAQNLEELCEKLRSVHPGAVYYHFWGRRLRPGCSGSEYYNDFASWAYSSLHDTALAERLGVIGPSSSSDPEELREKLIEAIERELRKSVPPTSSRRDEQFHFVRAQTVVFDTEHVIERPEELERLIPELSDGSIFYHFIDALRRTPSATNDLSVWLSDFGGDYKELSGRLSRIEPYFLSFGEIRERLASAAGEFFKGRRK